MKILSYKFFNKTSEVEDYSKMYRKINFKTSYPANFNRLKIFKYLLKKYRPKKIIDAGCGAGIPLIEIKKMGLNIKGYDKSLNMVNEAKQNLIKYSLPESLIQVGDFENPKHIKNHSVDCILGMGAFYYSRNFKKTILNQKLKLKKKGRLIFSLRNQLFDIATLNDYTINFLNQIYEIKKFNKKIKRDYMKLFRGFNKRKNLNLKNIDDQKVYSNTHNPLTIQNFLQEIGLKCDGIYFYHFHALPPVFEKTDKVKFRKISLQMEKPDDWRGFLIASGFVVDCQKI